MDFKELVGLIENGRDRFYTHVRVVGQSESAELQYLLGRWMFRLVAYQGAWVNLKSPDSLDCIDLAQLRVQMTHVLLTEYCYYELHEPLENEIRKYNIKKYFGEEICNKSLEDMKEFQEGLVAAIKKINGPKLTLIKK